MPQSNEAHNPKKEARSCSLCGEVFERSVAYCPKDGSKLLDSLVDTERTLSEVVSLERSMRQLLSENKDNPGVPSDDGRDTIKTGGPRDAQAETGKVNPQDLIGKIIDGRFRVDEILGSGGMSVVYGAFEIFLNKRVALKMLLPHMTLLPLSLERFRQEARAASTLNHPNVISVFSFGAPEGQAYLAMDYLRGWSLSDLVGDGKALSPERATHIFEQISDALSHAHEKGVIHRDLKPSNIILIEQGDDPDFVKIVDFGIAKMADQEGTDAVRLTQTGEIFGSPLYMSPEQAKGEALDARSDIYSLGCLMYETLSGNTPHKGGNSLEIMYKHMNDVPAPLSAANKKIPQRLEKIVFKALAKAPSERYQTMQAMHKDLTAFAKEQKFGFAGAIADKLELLWLKRRPKTAHERAIATVCGVSLLFSAALAGWLCNLYWSAANSRASKEELKWQDPDLVLHIASETQARSAPTIEKRSDKAHSTETAVQEHTVSFFTEDHPWQAIIVHRKCAQNFMDSGRYRQALEELTTALHLSEEINGKNAITTVWIQMLLAECYYRLNNFKICSQILANILANTRHLPLPTRITAHEEYLYGMALTHEHKNVQAERALKNGINMWINSCSGHNLTSERTGIYANLPDRPLTEEFTMAVARLGDIEMFLHDYQAATHYYNRVAQYSRDSDSTTDSTKELNADQVASLTNEAIAYDRLGQCALLQGNLAAAPAHYAKAVYTMKRAVGGKSALVGAVTRDYAAALWKTGRYLDFLYQQYKAMDIFAKAK